MCTLIVISKTVLLLTSPLLLRVLNNIEKGKVAGETILKNRNN